MQTPRPVVPSTRCPPKRPRGPETRSHRQEQLPPPRSTHSRAIRRPKDRYGLVPGVDLQPARLEALVECWTQQDLER
jgi:hypothetical protein